MTRPRDLAELRRALDAIWGGPIATDPGAAGAELRRRHWRLARPAPAPMPCERCRGDCRDRHILVGASRYCVDCGIAEVER